MNYAERNERKWQNKVRPYHFAGIAVLTVGMGMFGHEVMYSERAQKLEHMCSLESVDCAGEYIDHAIVSGIRAAGYSALGGTGGFAVGGLLSLIVGRKEE